MWDFEHMQVQIALNTLQAAWETTATATIYIAELTA